VRRTSLRKERRRRRSNEAESDAGEEDEEWDMAEASPVFAAHIEGALGDTSAVANAARAEAAVDTDGAAAAGATGAPGVGDDERSRRVSFAVVQRITADAALMKLATTATLGEAAAEPTKTEEEQAKADAEADATAQAAEAAAGIQRKPVHSSAVLAEAFSGEVCDLVLLEWRTAT
jgi:hypothetical protein